MSFFFRKNPDKVLIAKTLEMVRDSELDRLEDIIHHLPEAEEGVLAHNSIIKERCAAIDHQRRIAAFASRSYMREAQQQILSKEIEAFMYQASGFNAPVGPAFCEAAKRWFETARKDLNEIRRSSARESRPQTFRAGDPIYRDQEAFLPRLKLLGQIERQLLLATGCPGLIIYARRRMGKSTLLTNLASFLPQHFQSVWISMQDPAAFTSQNHFIAAIHHIVSKQLKQIDEDPPVDLNDFFRMLEQWNRAMGDRGRLLIAVDEYENMDHKLNQGVFSTDLLATLRESIQRHRRITWLFAGSHQIDELQGDWTSYLVSARTIEIPCFTLEETHLLLTDPLKHSRFWGQRESRPRFDAAFWGGEAGIKRLHDQTGGWPHFVQLLAERAVDLVNENEAERVDDALFAQALDEAVISGHNVFYELLRNECRSDAEWTYLLGFRGQETQAPPEDPNITAALHYRQLITETPDGLTLKVPLMRHWLIRRVKE